MPTQPTGTVTFLFTDIEGSTTRWEHQHRAMQQALARHDEIMREAIEAHGGHAFKTVGDAFYAVFATAPDAVEAALRAQALLQREAWEAALGPLRVRMALHTGAAEERDGDYFGQPLNRVARLLGAGHGGQILLSAATHELVRDQLPASTELRDLGEHRLKDLIRPEHIFQAVAADLPTDFPSLKTLDSRPNNLPLQPTPLIGREAHVAAVHDRLLQPAVRLLTLTGPGGTGKTRLALQVAADLLDSFPDGVFFVNLALISEPNLVVSTIAQTLSVTEAGGRPLLEMVQAYLRDKHLLLLLDNFEQVVEAAPVVADLLQAAPRLKALVTSRVALRLSGEHEYAVPPLTLPDPKRLPPLERLAQYEAVRLFIERAQAAKADFMVTNVNAPAVAEICVRLDGLPLAIELAAARSKLLSPEALLARLSNRLKLLTGGARDLPARQQTLRAAIDWSYGLLEPGEQTLFARLAVFAGGCTLEAIEAVCNADRDLPIDLFDGVASLLDKSLLRQEEGPDGEPRFVMLETIHEYASEQLEASGDAETLRRRHADYFLALVEEAEPQLTGPEQGAWLDELEEEHDNLRAVLRWSLQREGGSEMALHLAVTLRRFWTRRSHMSEGRGWLEAALEVGGTVQPSLRAEAFCCAGMLARLQGDYPRATQLCEAGLALYRELGDRWGIAFAVNELGRMVTRTGEYAQAQALLEESLALRRGIGDKSLVAYALDGLGSLAVEQGEYGRAQALQEESLALRRGQRDQRDISESLRRLGKVVLLQGDYARAEGLLEESLQLLQQLGTKQDVGAALRYLGRVVLLQGDYARAEGLLEESLQLLREVGTKQDVAGALYTLGVVKLFQGDDARARVLFKESLVIRQELRDQAGIAECIEGFAMLPAGSEQHRPEDTLDPQRAAVLFGAAAALRVAIGAPLPPVDRPAYDRHLTVARARLDEAAWMAAWAEGWAMPLERVIAYALEQHSDG